MTTTEFGKTLRRGSGGDNEDGYWSHDRLCQRSDGRYFRVSERSSWGPDHEGWDVEIYPCNETGENLSPRHPAASMGGGSDSCSDEQIFAAVDGITEQQIADAIRKSRDSH